MGTAALSFDRAYAECKANPSWITYVAENSHHDVMIDQPEWLADIPDSTPECNCG